MFKPSCRPDSFNSRSRAGSDCHIALRVSSHIVSIHAPVRGATPARAMYFSADPRFQFTLPCGERRKSLFPIPQKLCFNSRSRAGSDACSYISKLHVRLFQFTLPCGERHYEQKATHTVQVVSIHAPVRGATTENNKITFGLKFQFTLPCGERLP